MKWLDDTYDITGNLFTPAMTAAISTIGTEKQRKLKHAGFAPFLEDKTTTAHSRYTFSEVVLWSLVAEVNRLGFDLECAGYFAAGMIWDKYSHDGKLLAKSSGQALLADYRESQLFLVCTPTIGEPRTFSNVSTSGPDQTQMRGRFGFWIDYSDFQRRLMKRIESVIE